MRAEVNVTMLLLALAACAPADIGDYPDDDPNNGSRRRDETDEGADTTTPDDETSVADPTLTVTLTGKGTVTSTPGGLKCQGSTCVGSFAKGTSVNLVSSPEAGGAFAGWGGACTGAGSCTATMNGDVDVTAQFQSLDGTWTGTYTQTRKAHGCTFNNKGTLSVTITSTGATPSAAATITGLEIRNIPSCEIVDSRGSTATAPIKNDGDKLTGSWDFAIEGISGTLAMPYTATVEGNKLNGSWTCETCTGSITLTRP